MDLFNGPGSLLGKVVRDRIACVGGFDDKAQEGASGDGVVLEARDLEVRVACPVGQRQLAMGVRSAHGQSYVQWSPTLRGEVMQSMALAVGATASVSSTPATASSAVRRRVVFMRFRHGWDLRKPLLP